MGSKLRIPAGSMMRNVGPIEKSAKSARRRIKSPGEIEQIVVTVMIEIPKGCRNRYEYDKERKMLKFDRMLFSAVHYPSDYGFILGTLGHFGPRWRSS